MTPARLLPRRLRRRLRDLWRGETADTFFDVHNLDEINAVLVPRGVAPLTADPRQADDGVRGAARFVLGLLAARKELPRRFPAALTAGPDGNYARWLAANAADIDLSPNGAENVRAAFAARLGDKGKRVYEVRRDLRAAYPFGQTPHPHRGLFLGWMVTHGAADLGLTPEEALWFLAERDEEPDRGLVATYLVRPDWQEAVPHALTVFGWREFVRYLRTTHGLRGRWLGRATLRSPYRPWDQLAFLRQARPDLATTLPAAGKAEVVLDWLDRQPGLVRPSAEWRAGLHEDFATGLPARTGVNVLAHFRYPSGLQEAAFAVVKGLTESGVRTAVRDLPAFFDCDWRDRERYQGVEQFDTTIYVAAVNSFPVEWYRRSGLRYRPGVRRIALWYWELEDLHLDWVPDIQWPDDVWAPTRFVADAFRKYVTAPVVPMLPGVTLPAFAPRPRSHFDLPDDRFLFLFTFDMGSVMERKNPLGLIRAFRRAFRPDDPAHLAVKVSRGSADPESFARLKAAAGSDGAVTLIDRVLPREDVLAILNAADCYASLHRSEGLGLGMAESMLLGKPVIGTAYSGNLDFMTPDASHLVEYRRVAIETEPTALCPYPKGSHWAEPSVEHAAALMRAVYDRPEEARELGERGRRHVAELLAPDAAARRMVARLAALGVVPGR